MVEAIDDSGPPSLNVAHGVFPHSPWTLTPDGDAYGSVTEGLDFDPRLVWEDDLELVVRGQIQHLLQLGQADAAVGRLIDRLEETGQWEESLVVVVADHGAGFEPGGQHREPSADNLDEVFRVPMFVKYPDQTEGVIDDQPAQTSDLVPTVVETLDAEVAWEFDGVPLSEDRSERTPIAILRDGSEITLDPSVEPLLELARRNHDRFPHRDDWLGVVAVGQHGVHVGEDVDDLDPDPGAGWSWSTDRATDFERVEEGFVPIQFTGALSGPAGLDEPSVLLAVNGTVAGVGTQVTEGDEDGSWTFSTIVAPELFELGSNDVELLVEDPEDPDSFLLVPADGAADWTVERDGDGRPESVRLGDEVLPVVADGDDEDRRLHVDDDRATVGERRVD
ncbi:MAG: sulfatase-like hydrolase/transferase, partial [Actinomycetota bacterium]